MGLSAFAAENLGLIPGKGTKSHKLSSVANTHTHTHMSCEVAPPGLQARDKHLGKENTMKAMAPTPALLPGKPHGWRSPVGYSPWGHEESDTTE